MKIFLHYLSESKRIFEILNGYIDNIPESNNFNRTIDTDSDEKRNQFIFRITKASEHFGKTIKERNVTDIELATPRKIARILLNKFIKQSDIYWSRLEETKQKYKNVDFQDELLREFTEILTELRKRLFEKTVI